MSLTVASLSTWSAARRSEFVRGLSNEAALLFLHDWRYWARPEQLPPATAANGGEWWVWLILAGRGFGKTRAICEWAHRQAMGRPGSRGAMVAATAADVRDVLVEGESGLLEIAPPWERPLYEPSKRRVTWHNGSQATLFSADVPGRLRGPQYHWAVADELAAWRYSEAWDMLQLGVRLGSDPRIVVATTPRPTQIVRDLIGDSTTAVTRGNTYANRANLAPRFLERITARYAGTRLGRQEIEGELLEDTPGALWTLSQIDALRVRNLHLLPEMQRVVVGVDPSATAGGDEAGIIVAGLGDDGHGYVLADASLQASPDGWARAAVAAYRANNADRIVAEVNNGGEMVQLTIRTVDPAVSYKAVHASRGKRTRAEPVAALYEQGRVHHIGAFAKLEDEMCTWSALENDPSPNRMDALVWALSELMLSGNARRPARSFQG